MKEINDLNRIFKLQKSNYSPANIPSPETLHISEKETVKNAKL